MMENNILQVSNLGFRYGKRKEEFELQNISFSLKEGYILGLVGRNGAGKTTLMNCILGKHLFTSGAISIDGICSSKRVETAKDDLGFIMEPAPFLENYTLGENGSMFGPFYSKWDESKFLRLLDEYKLDSYDKYVELSRGMRVKFQLAFALAHEPKLLILDEPTGGLDPVFRREFLSIIQKEVAKRMMSVIISTHITEELDSIADYIVMIDQGKIICNGCMEELREQYSHTGGTILDILCYLLEV